MPGMTVAEKVELTLIPVVGAAVCMCVESTIGVTGVVTGLAVLGSALDATLALGPEAMGAIAVVVLAIGFAIKDLVFELRPFRIRRDKDHLNIVFRWKP